MILNPTLRSLTNGILSVVCIGAFHGSTIAQQLIDIGTGVIQNNNFEYPCPYGNQQPGARQQMLVLASELTAAGMYAGPISSVAFNVAVPSGTTFTSYTVSIGATAVSDMTTTYVEPLAPVWGPQDYTDVTGWNTHTFATPFDWDGVSNICVQTCFYNGNNSQNAQVFQSTTTFNSVISRSTPNNNVCMSNTGTHVLYQQRPNMRFEWTAPDAPPVAAFNQSTTFSCDGIVQFTDASVSFSPTTWHWDFGDLSTDTVPSPTHTYADGTFTPTLIVVNAFGSDTLVGSPITVNASGPRPIVPACTPASIGSVAGLGLISVTINGQVTASPDATEGYADHSCRLDTVLVGTILNITAITGTAAQHNVRAWVDWDNSGTFTGNELVLSANQVFNAGSATLVPAFAFLNAPLRIRVMANFYLLTPPDGCTDVNSGQAEDYCVVVIPNPNPPTALFSAAPTFTCDGVVQFTDGSLNTPTSWQWDFGDASPISNEQSPLHVYTTGGIYNVTLIATNANGADTLLQNAMITVDLNSQLVAATCTPQTQGYCCGYGILGVQFAGINSTSPDASEGYQDRSCGNTATVQEGSSFPISIATGTQNAHDTWVYIDMNNDGAFTATELVYTALNQISPSGSAAIPQGSVYNVPVRVRVRSDVVGGPSAACIQPTFGQVEDFSAIITPNTNPPNPNFIGAPTTTCDGIVQFTDMSTNLPTSWLWNFGDTQTSTSQSPSHTYTAAGTYTVSLTATNAFGSNAHTANNYIHFIGAGLCDTLSVDAFNDQSFSECHGVLADDGGPNANYSPGISGATTIAPVGAEFVTLTFSEFDFDAGGAGDYLAIFDGPDIGSPLIGQFTGAGLGQLPNNGVISSTGSTITLQQQSTFGMGVAAGFLLNWDCAITGIAETNSNAIGNIWPQPASDRFTVEFGRIAGSGWTISVTNVLGATVERTAVGIGERQRIFDATAWSPGCYLLSVETPEGRWSRTIAVR